MLPRKTWVDEHPMRPFATKDWLVAGALVLGGLFIFALDMTPLQGADDGAAYGLVVALAAYFGRRQVIASAILGGVLTVLAPFVGGTLGRACWRSSPGACPVWW